MGGPLFDEFPGFIEIADRVLGYSIKDLCLSDPDRRLAQTQYTQPALYTVNSLAYLRAIAAGLRPTHAAGHSLGEYCALFAAGAFDFETGLLLVKKRGELMSQARKGGMAAVFGLSADQIRDTLRNHGLRGVHIANLNSPSQIVVSGPIEEIESARSIFGEMAGVRYIQLNVGGAFHSPLMREAGEEFAEYLSRFQFATPTIAVVSNVTARPYETGSVARLLAEQITSPVQWADSIRYLLEMGETTFEEIGPGRVLTKLVQQIKSESAPVAPVVENRVRAEVAITEPTSRISESSATKGIGPSSLGSAAFRKDYNIEFACLAGSMHRGISSVELLVCMAKAGFMGFLGTRGMSRQQVDDAISMLQREVDPHYGPRYGVNLPSTPSAPELEQELVDLVLARGIRNIEASGYIQLSASLVRLRLRALERRADGSIERKIRILAKVSHPDVALAFLSPAPPRIVQKLLENGAISPEQAEMAAYVPIADDLTVASDCAGPTDRGIMSVLVPTMIRLRDEVAARHGYAQRIRIGAAGGIGTPEAALAAFVLGADYVVTGSINQCTVEAKTSDIVKDMLQGIGVQDTDYAPSADGFELGAEMQVLKKGVFFPARAKKLHELYRHYDSLEAIDEKTRTQLEQKYFKRSLADVWAQVKAQHLAGNRATIERAEQNPKHKMALLFRWYYDYTLDLALRGDTNGKVDFQVYCSPALGAFNQWVKGTELENWRCRNVDVIHRRLMEETATVMQRLIERHAGSLPRKTEG